MSDRPLTNQCPYCSESMHASECACKHCDIAVRGDFPMVPLSSLPTEHQRFIEMFVLASANLKEIASHAGVSYPTVRSRLDKVITALSTEITAQKKVSAKTKKGSGRKGSSKSSDAPSAAEIIKRI